MWMLASFALILLTLFSALNSHRVAVAPREKRVLQSVADKFRVVKESPEPHSAPPAWKVVMSHEGIRTLMTAFATLFGEDGKLTDSGKASFREILPGLVKRRTVVEISTFVPGAGVTAETIGRQLRAAEMRAENVRDFLIHEGLPAFSLSVKTSLYEGSEAALQLRVRAANERSGW